MAAKVDRVGELMDGVKYRRRTIVSPEGVPLEVRAATHGERLGAFLLDMLIMLAVQIFLLICMLLLFFSGTNISVGMTLFLFLAFLVRNLYFLHFELAWQGRTPGKKLCGIRVINRKGGELTPSAIIARNLTREVEFFLPLSLLLSAGFAADTLQQLVLTGWVLVIALLPLFNRDHLRAGDLIAGTQVIAMPKRVLLPDLSVKQQPAVQPEAQAGSGDSFAGYSFTYEQLSIYGAFELQVLEEFLRRPPNLETQKALLEICGKICRKIGWPDSVPASEVRRFLMDFYAAERAELERGQLFGRLREDKTAGAGQGGKK